MARLIAFGWQEKSSGLELNGKLNTLWEEMDEIITTDNGRFYSS